jgi:hypothetical protein
MDVFAERRTDDDHAVGAFDGTLRDADLDSRWYLDRVPTTW